MKENKNTRIQQKVDQSAYICPMHHEVPQAHPGCCPECGLVLVPSGHQGRMDQKSGTNQNMFEGHESQDGHYVHAGKRHKEHVNYSGYEQIFHNKFWVSLILAIPVLLYMQLVQKWLGFTMPDFIGSAWIIPVFSLILFLYGCMQSLQLVERLHHPARFFMQLTRNL